MILFHKSTNLSRQKEKKEKEKVGGTWSAAAIGKHLKGLVVCIVDTIKVLHSEHHIAMSAVL